ncbi:hypothetical protein EUGRSUZ_B03957 [Eucalyptus grandis]|uniref:Uncharacterized protein n=2 Tax=Eucalyptus grandis TaxID=71139 RepID=A0A059DAK4_EUCGR|nr:hypothetical protein EUGRSUZ_B03957 [Eucalyptus grandis]
MQPLTLYTPSNRNTILRRRTQNPINPLIHLVIFGDITDDPGLNLLLRCKPNPIDNPRLQIPLLLPQRQEGYPLQCLPRPLPSQRRLLDLHLCLEPLIGCGLAHRGASDLRRRDQSLGRLPVDHSPHVIPPIVPDGGGAPGDGLEAGVPVRPQPLVVAVGEGPEGEEAELRVGAEGAMEVVVGVGAGGDAGDVGEGTAVEALDALVGVRRGVEDLEANRAEVAAEAAQDAVGAQQAVPRLVVDVVEEPPLPRAGAALAALLLLAVEVVVAALHRNRRILYLSLSLSLSLSISLPLSLPPLFHPSLPL